MVRSWFGLATAVSLVPAVLSVTVGDIQGSAFQSPLVGQTVHNLTGIVTAKVSTGFYISGPAVKDDRVSTGLNVFTSSKTILASINVGDSISLSGKVAEFKSSSDPDYLTATELDSPANITVFSHNNTVKPIILGKNRSPPTEQLSALDKGPDGILSVPNNQSLVDSVNATLQPTKYGLDFWESLEGMLVTVPNPTALDFENSYGEIWVYGDWPVTGKNSRGGLSLTFNSQNVPDANPEVIIIGTPIDGTKNPSAAVGQTFEDITGVVQYQFGFFYIIPTTALVTKSTPSKTAPPTSLAPVNNPCTITIGDYNIDNFSPTASQLPAVATHIATFLKSPDIMFLQEIQDNSGSTDDGVVDANVTLTNLINAITNASVNAGGPAVTYDFLQISPLNDVSGGEPGGNIRCAYLYRPDKVKLAGSTIAGGALNATAVTSSKGVLGLTLNPGLVDPTNSAWDDSRKPLAAVWESALKSSKGTRFFTVNVHLTSKDGSGSTQSNARTPVNLGVDQRTDQINTVAAFAKSILAEDKNANIIVAGDHNEFLQTRSAFQGYDDVPLTDVDTISGVPQVERYTYVFDYENEQLDHILVSNAIKKRGTKVEHVHVNNWELLYASRASDHDPSVAKLQIC